MAGRIIKMGSSDSDDITIYVSTINDLLDMPTDFPVNVLGYHIENDGGGGLFVWNSFEDRADHNGGTIIDPDITFPTDWDNSTQRNAWFTAGAGSGTWNRLYDQPINPKWFGAKGDGSWDGTDRTGTDDTNSIQAMLNFCSYTGDAIQIPGGHQSLVGTLYFYYDVTKNSGWNTDRKPGRISISGSSSGLCSGLLEDNGSAFIHKDGIAAPLIDVTADFELAGNTGNGVDFNRISFVGGSETTSVIYMQYVSTLFNIDRFNVRVVNPDGHGITLDISWNGSISNGVIKGNGNSTTPVGWTGIGLNITNENSSATALGNQVNMLTITAVDSREMGIGCFIGRFVSVVRGTFNSLAVTAFQFSNNELYGLQLAGGCYGGAFISTQFEGNYKNGVIVKAETDSNDLARGYTFHECYWTNNGKSIDENSMVVGDNDGYAFRNIDGVGISINGGYFQNTRGGIRVHPDAAIDMAVNNIILRARTSAKGVGISIDSGVTEAPTSRTHFENFRYQVSFATNLDDTKNVLALGDAGGRTSVSGNSATPSIAISNKTDTFGILNLNNAGVTTVTNILGAKMYQPLIITFSNLNSTIQDNANIYLNNSADFTPTTSRGVMVLYYDGKWKEISRSSG